MLLILTNTGAAQAVRALNGATAEVALHQQRITTGRTVNGTKDDSATYVIAQSLRSDAGSRRAIGQSMARASSVIDVAASGTEQISDLVNQIKSKAYSLNGESDARSRAAIRLDIEALVSQIDTVAKSADFNGTNLLLGKQSQINRTTTTTTMSHSTYALPPLPTMASLPQGSKLVNTSSSSFNLATSPLTPASFSTALGSLTGTDMQTVTLNAGSTAGRVLMTLDAYSVPDVVEVWQNGVRMAATGTAYTPGGAAVAPGAAVSGKALLAFDYDPTKGQNLEIRVNPNGAAPGTAWSINAMQLQDPADPVPSGSSYQSSSQLVATAPGTTPATASDPEQAGQALQVPPDNQSASYAVNLGSQNGRIDVAFDAFGLGDTMEVWQNGVRVAATGQAYSAGGGAVAPGAAVSGKNVVSFDYDAAKGPVTFSFNPNGTSADSAWAVTGVALNQTTDPIATVASSNVTAQGVGYSPVSYGILSGLNGETIRIGSRNLTSSGLGLDQLDWSEPSRILDAVTGAANTIKEALSHFGSKARAFDMAASFNSKLGDVLEGAVGGMVDADLAVESAKLQAAQIKQQLAAKALSIANEQPKIILSLFD